MTKEEAQALEILRLQAWCEGLMLAVNVLGNCLGQKYGVEWEPMTAPPEVPYEQTPKGS